MAACKTCIPSGDIQNPFSIQFPIKEQVRKPTIPEPLVTLAPIRDSFFEPALALKGCGAIVAAEVSEVSTCPSSQAMKNAIFTVELDAIQQQQQQQQLPFFNCPLSVDLYKLSVKIHNSANALERFSDHACDFMSASQALELQSRITKLQALATILEKELGTLIRFTSPED